MSNPVDPSMWVQQPLPAEKVIPPTQAPDAKTAGDIAMSNTTKKFTSDTKVKNMAEIKEKAPELYDSMIKGIMETVIGRMRRAHDRMIKRMKEMRRK